MPASWWERMHLGASDDAIGSEDARLVFTHVLHRLIDQETATDAFSTDNQAHVFRKVSALARLFNLVETSS